MEWYSETWRESGANFLVEIKRWTEGEKNRWNVYAYIYPKHPIFKQIKDDSLFLDHILTSYFHCGLSYHKWHRNKDSDVVSKQLGSDYEHLYDNFHHTTKLADTPCESDALELIYFLKENDKHPEFA